MAPRRDPRSANTRTLARSDAALTIVQACTRLIARGPAGPCLREKKRGACGARPCSFAQSIRFWSVMA